MSSLLVPRNPPSGSVVVAPTIRCISLYMAFFREGNFHLPMTTFTSEVFTRYGIHISQVNPIGSYSFNSHGGGVVIPINMHLRKPKEKVPKEKVVVYEGTPWYETLTTLLTPMWQLKEDALVAAGMSLL
ncbi:hypothetical protein Hanom_Chr17g01565381 [Helianthus anomalus]